MTTECCMTLTDARCQLQNIQTWKTCLNPFTVKWSKCRKTQRMTCLCSRLLMRSPQVEIFLLKNYADLTFMFNRLLPWNMAQTPIVSLFGNGIRTKTLAVMMLYFPKDTIRSQMHWPKG